MCKICPGCVHAVENLISDHEPVPEIVFLFPQYARISPEKWDVIEVLPILRAEQECRKSVHHKKFCQLVASRLLRHRLDKVRKWKLAIRCQRWPVFQKNPERAFQALPGDQVKQY